MKKVVAQKKKATATSILHAQGYKYSFIYKVRNVLLLSQKRLLMSPMYSLIAYAFKNFLKKSRACLLNIMKMNMTY